MASALPDGWHTVTPRIVVEDPARLIEFLRATFGATGELRTDAPSVIRIGDSMIMISGAGFRKITTGFLHVYVDDADETFRRALGSGAVCVEEPQATPYGDRRAMIVDPCGNEWQIATYSPQ
jgi:PhnB protein